MKVALDPAGAALERVGSVLRAVSVPVSLGTSLQTGIYKPNIASATSSAIFAKCR